MLTNIAGASAENLRAVALRTSDPEILLGLAYLAPQGDAVRREISEAAVKLRPEYAPIVAVLAVAMDAVNEPSARQLIESDPENALGHYLQAHLLYQAGQENESLPTFRKAAACGELRLYSDITANALFKALDAMGIQGRDRLEALSWTASRMSNFYGGNLQHLRTDLQELARKAEPAARNEICDLLFIVAGHLFATNFSNRQFAEWTAADALSLKARIAAANKSPAASGYLAAAHAVRSKHWRWSSINEREEDPLQSAQFLPSRIWSAIGLVEITKKGGSYHIGFVAKLEGDGKTAHESAQQKAAEAAEALIEACVNDPDGVIGPYLKGLPTPQKSGPPPWISAYTHVDVLIKKRPGIFEAVAASEKALRALQRVSDNDPGECNLRKLMAVGTAISWYMANNDQRLPESLEVLYQDGKFLTDASQIQSLLTGKPYVFAAAGGKVPEKMHERQRYIVVYDYVEEEGLYYFVTGCGSGSRMGAVDFEKYFGKRGS